MSCEVWKIKGENQIGERGTKRKNVFKLTQLNHVCIGKNAGNHLYNHLELSKKSAESLTVVFYRK